MRINTIQSYSWYSSLVVKAFLAYNFWEMASAVCLKDVPLNLFLSSYLNHKIIVDYHQNIVILIICKLCTFYITWIALPKQSLLRFHQILTGCTSDIYRFSLLYKPLPNTVALICYYR